MSMILIYKGLGPVVRLFDLLHNEESQIDEAK